jgi:hypothetical protein
MPFLGLVGNLTQSCRWELGGCSKLPLLSCQPLLDHSRLNFLYQKIACEQAAGLCKHSHK